MISKALTLRPRTSVRMAMLMVYALRRKSCAATTENGDSRWAFDAPRIVSPTMVRLAAAATGHRNSVQLKAYPIQSVATPNDARNRAKGNSIVVATTNAIAVASAATVTIQAVASIDRCSDTARAAAVTIVRPTAAMVGVNTSNRVVASHSSGYTMVAATRPWQEALKRSVAPLRSTIHNQ